LADPISGMSPVSVMLYEEDLLSPLVRLDIRVSLCWAKTCKMASSISPFWLSDSQNGPNVVGQDGRQVMLMGSSPDPLGLGIL
jgi:hypothetical protein